MPVHLNFTFLDVSVVSGCGICESFDPMYGWYFSYPLNLRTPFCEVRNLNIPLSKFSFKLFICLVYIILFRWGFLSPHAHSEPLLIRVFSFLYYIKTANSIQIRFTFWIRNYVIMKLFSFRQINLLPVIFICVNYYGIYSLWKMAFSSSVLMLLRLPCFYGRKADHFFLSLTKKITLWRSDCHCESYSLFP